MDLQKKTSDEILKELFNSINDIVSSEDDGVDVETKVIVKKQKKSKKSYDSSYSSRGKQKKKKKRSKTYSTKYSLHISSRSEEAESGLSGKLKRRSSKSGKRSQKKEVPLIEVITKEVIEGSVPGRALVTVKKEADDSTDPEKAVESTAGQIADVFAEDRLDSGLAPQGTDQLKKGIQIQNLKNVKLLGNAADSKVDDLSSSTQHEEGELSSGLDSDSDADKHRRGPKRKREKSACSKRKKKRSKHLSEEKRRSSRKKVEETEGPDSGRQKTSSRERHCTGVVARHCDRQRRRAGLSSRDRKRERSRSPERRHRSRSRNRESRRGQTRLRREPPTSDTDFISYCDRGRPRQEKDEYFIDKGKLLEIARKNALSMLKQGQVGVDGNKVVHITAGGKTVDELTDFCKHLSRKEATGVESMSSGVSSDESEQPFHHPFQLKERPSKIIMNIRNCVQLPAKTHQEKATETLRLQFPVSSGQHHRKTESEWVLVEPKATEVKTLSTISTAKDTTGPPERLAIEAAPCLPPPTLPSGILTQYPIYPSPAERKAIDIGAIITERLALISKEHDVPSTSSFESRTKWDRPSSQVGLFTGSTGVKVLSPFELSAGQQAWAKKDQLMCAQPVSGGMGMSLLQKMGWKPGEGLGKNNEGTLEPLKLQVKMDKKGLVCAEEMSWRPRQSIAKVGARASVPALKSVEGKHPVSVLVELCTRRRYNPPEFHTVSEDGPPHQKRFIIKVVVDGVDYQPCVSSSTKKLAKSEAAKVCLRTLGFLPNS